MYISSCDWLEAGVSVCTLVLVIGWRGSQCVYIRYFDWLEAFSVCTLVIVIGRGSQCVYISYCECDPHVPQDGDII